MKRSVIAVNMDGGIVQSVGLLEGGPVDVIFVDYDTDGADEESVESVPQNGSNSPSNAYIIIEGASLWPDDETTQWIRNRYKESL